MNVFSINEKDKMKEFLYEISLIHDSNIVSIAIKDDAMEMFLENKYKKQNFKLMFSNIKEMHFYNEIIYYESDEIIHLFFDDESKEDNENLRLFLEKVSGQRIHIVCKTFAFDEL